MDERISDITAALKQVADKTRVTFGGLSTEQLNWKPAENSWSIAQCFDHIIKTNEQFYPEFEKVASGKRKNTFFQNYSPFTGMMGRFLITAVSEDSKKAKAPSKRIVPPSEIGGDIVDRFVVHIDEVIRKIGTCAAADRKTTVLSSPFLRVLTYTLDDAYTILVEHTKRHFRQAKRVKEMEEFPKLDGLESPSYI